MIELAQSLLQWLTVEHVLALIAFVVVALAIMTVMRPK